MLNKLKFLFFIIIIVLSLNYISAGISVNPSLIPLGGTATIYIDFPQYNGHIWFYERNSNELISISIGLNCGEECSGSQSLDMDFGYDYFPIGNYKMAIFSRDSAKWVYANFEIGDNKCSDGTVYGECSTTKPEYCVNGLLTNNCDFCGCPSGQNCQADGTCIPSATECYDNTLVGECSTSTGKPYYCGSTAGEAELIINCTACGCPEIYPECNPTDGTCGDVTTPNLKSDFFKNDPIAISIVNGNSYRLISEDYINDLYVLIDSRQARFRENMRINVSSFEYKLFNAFKEMGYNLFGEELPLFLNTLQEDNNLPVSDIVDSQTLLLIDYKLYEIEKQDKKDSSNYAPFVKFLSSPINEPSTQHLAALYYRFSNTLTSNLPYWGNTIDDFRSNLLWGLGANLGTLLDSSGTKILGGSEYLDFKFCASSYYSGFSSYYGGDCINQKELLKVHFPISDYDHSYLTNHEYGHSVGGGLNITIKGINDEMHYQFGRISFEGEFVGHGCVDCSEGNLNWLRQDNYDEFVSLYAREGYRTLIIGGSLSPQEDFAESFTYYRLQGSVFREKAKRNIYLKQKYDFLKDYVFDGMEYNTGNIEDYNLFLSQNPNVTPLELLTYSSSYRTGQNNLIWNGTYPILSSLARPSSKWSPCNNGYQTRTILILDSSSSYTKGTVILSQHCLGNVGDSCLFDFNCASNFNRASGLTCQSGTCGAPVPLPSIPIGQNKKTESLYSNKEVFLVSDSDWKNVLPFVSAAVWTEGSEVKKYPFLIYHEENLGDIEEISLTNNMFSVNLVAGLMTTSGLWDESCTGDSQYLKVIGLEKTLEKILFHVGEDIPLKVTIKNCATIQKNIDKLEIEVQDEYDLNYVGYNINYLGENLGVLNPEETKEVYVVLTFRGEDFDVDSIIYFMQQYSPSEVTIIGDTNQELDNLLVTSQHLGAGLQQSQIKRISTLDYISYWESFNKVVYVQEDYELSLLASTYASLINSPLIIKGSKLDSTEIFSGREIICMGDVTPAGSSCSETYDLDSLRQKYKTETNTDKVILVNPEDYSSFYSASFCPEKSYSCIHNLYYKDSLIAPILASARQELLLSINSPWKTEDLNFYPEHDIVR